MTLLRVLLLMLFSSLLSGCIDVETVIFVRADGSGRVEERMLLGAELAALGAQMQGMQGSGQESGFPFDRKELEERAAKMGAGVRLDSVEPLQDGARMGYRAVFAFDDINQLQLDENPPAPPTGAPEEESKSDAPSLMTFQFRRGEPAELIVRTAMQPTADAGADPGVEAGPMATKGGGGGSEPGSGATPAIPQDAQTMAMMQQMFREMRIAVRIEVEGEILESNASFREGSRVTLIEMDFGKLMENPAKFNELIARNPQKMEEMKSLLEGVTGMKVETKPEVQIRFSGVVVRRADLPAAPLAATPPARRLQRVEVIDSRGMTLQGTLVEEPPQLLRFRRPESEGGGLVELPLTSLRQVRLSGPGF